MTFLPAKNKLEAVNRLSALTGSGPETLGPGSKERKSVLLNLASGLEVRLSKLSSKQLTAAAIASKLGIPWLPRYESVGQTITLEGLNALLDASESFFEKPERREPLQNPQIELELFADLDEWHSETAPANTKKPGQSFSDATSAKACRLDETEDFPDPNAEAALIVSVLKHKIPRTFNGKKCVIEMKEAEYANWQQTEWQGFYFEMLAFSGLVSTIGGARKKVLSTEFDYFRYHLWDMKTHSSQNAKGSKSTSAILNDKDSIDEALRLGGIGFIILSGIPTYSRAFTIWHKTLRAKIGAPRKELKEYFENQSIDLFWVDSPEALEEALENKIFSVFKQGKQPDGSPRKPKYSINVEKAKGTNLLVAEYVY
jgi:hypothetical protein